MHLVDGFCSAGKMKGKASAGVTGGTNQRMPTSGRGSVSASLMARDNAVRLYSWSSRKNDILSVIKQVASVLG